MSTENVIDTGQNIASDASPLWHRVRSLWPMPLLALMVALVYWPGRGGGFVFDDFANIVDNTALHVKSLDWHAWIAAMFSSDAGLLQRPLSMLTFAINYYTTGMDPVPMKLTNIGIHALNACLVLCLVRRLLAVVFHDAPAPRREWAARFAAAAWALHPINLMAVLFVVQRMESLSHTFVFAGLWLYLIGRQRQLQGQPGWMAILAGIIGGTTLGTLCKESAVLLPLYAGLIEICLPGLRGKGARQGLRLLFALVLLLPACAGAVWMLQRYLPASAYGRRSFDLDQRLLTEGRVVLDYLRWTLFPSLRELSLYHDDYPISRSLLEPISTLFSFVSLAVLAALAWVLRRRQSLVTLGIAWFFAGQMLTATLVPLELVFEHRNYFASLGVCVALASLLLLAPRQETPRRLGILVAVIWLAALTSTTHLRAREWSDPFRFASTEAAKHPQSPRAAYAYARLLAMATEYKADSPLLKPAFEALEKARALPSSGILAHSALLTLAVKTGVPPKDAWWNDMEERLRTDPVGPQEGGAIGTLARCARDGDCSFPTERMLATFQAALSQKPNAEIMNIYADYVLNVIHQPKTALYLWERAIALSPKTPQYRINRIKLLIALRQDEQAQQEIEQLRELGRFGQDQAAADALSARLDRQASMFPALPTSN